MRFNDLLRTVLANAGEGSGATVTRWRQGIDLLAQYDVSGAQSANAIDAQAREAVLSMIAELRLQVSLEQRIASIVELGPRLRSPGLVRLLAQDHPSLVSAMMAHVRLTDADWAAIIPDLGPLARSVLRRREDLDVQAQAALRQFGTIDMALPSLVPAGELEAMLERVANDGADDTPTPAAAESETSQIGRIVAQIERFTEARAHRQDDEPPAREVETDLPDLPLPEPVPPVTMFTFEADAAGQIRLVSGAPRGAAVGLSIGMPALDSRHGADGLALGAFRRRAAFEDARFTIGEGVLEGEWRMSAEPRFDRASGRFLGYVGSARREFPHESLVRAAPAEQKSWAGLSAASSRQLIHELRTPLNAIQGYAEMIEAQILGPVTAEYQDMAKRILADAKVLLTTFDDLDLASRIEHGDHRASPERLDLAQMLGSVVGAFAQGGEPRVDVQAEEGLPLVGGDRAQIERMLSHFVRAGWVALGEGERLALALTAEGASVSLEMQRPWALRQISEADLLDHGYLVDQKLRDAPPLGLAFTLKLVKGIAAHAGGRLEIAADSFRLVLPVSAAADSGQESLR